jgi:hypothetical protein
MSIFEVHRAGRDNVSVSIRRLHEVLIVMFQTCCAENRRSPKVCIHCRKTFFCHMCDITENRLAVGRLKISLTEFVKLCVARAIQNRFNGLYAPVHASRNVILTLSAAQIPSILIKQFVFYFCVASAKHRMSQRTLCLLIYVCLLNSSKRAVLKARASKQGKATIILLMFPTVQRNVRQNKATQLLYC